MYSNEEVLLDSGGLRARKRTGIAMGLVSPSQRLARERPVNRVRIPLGVHPDKEAPEHRWCCYPTNARCRDVGVQLDCRDAAREYSLSRGHGTVALGGGTKQGHLKPCSSQP